MSGALNAGLRSALEDDDKVIVMGEDVGKLGGVFRVTDGLQKDFGDHRVIDTPLAESGIIGTAVGLAMRGYRPVCEIQFDGFVYPAFDQIVSQVAVALPHQGRGGNAADHPNSLRGRNRCGGTSFGVTRSVFRAYGRPTRGVLQLTAGRLRHDPAGCRVRRPGGLLRTQAAILGEGRGRYRAGACPTRCRARCPVRTAATIAAYGPMVAVANAAAELAATEGISLEVVDLRSLSPVDFDTLEASVRKTGRLIVVHEAPVFMGLGAEIAARITERCFYHLEAPVLRVGGFALPYPANKVEHHYLPDAERVMDAVDRAIAA